jgi:hypothetical protein
MQIGLHDLDHTFDFWIHFYSSSAQPAGGKRFSDALPLCSFGTSVSFEPIAIRPGAEPFKLFGKATLEAGGLILH